jgi:hypothetical protein
VCWEHLKRDFYKHSEGLAEQKEFGQAGLALTKQLFKTWHAFEEHGDRARLISEMAAIKTELRTLLEHAARNSARTRYHRRFAKNLLKIWPALFTFVTIEGVQPTNNAARERSAARSSTASSPTAPNPTTASGSSSERYQSQSPAACKPAQCSPTCTSCSAPTPAATRCPRSPERRLNAYILGGRACRGGLGDPAVAIDPLEPNGHPVESLFAEPHQPVNRDAPVTDPAVERSTGPAEDRHLHAPPGRPAERGAATSIDLVQQRCYTLVVPAACESNGRSPQ